MKKIAFLIFIAAIAIGICVAYASGTVSSSRSWFNFSFGGVKGSGNIKTETRDLPKFTAIDFGGAIEMEVTAGKAQSVEIETDDNILPLITTEVKGDTLYISSQKRYRNSKSVRVRINLEELNSLEVSGASKAVATDVRSDNFKVNVSGASKVKLAGEGASLTADASGASRVEAENFKAVKVAAHASGASRVLVFASETVKADASGASNVTYSGNPKNVTKHSSGASSISSN